MFAELHTCHALIPLSICQIPTAIKLPNMRESELPQNQIPCLSGCSEDRYQSEVIRLNPGEMLASVTPKKNRVIMIPVKFVVAAWHARTTDQMILCGY
jgi:hypothetical protein